jgi:hypothetical protein
MFHSACKFFDDQIDLILSPLKNCSFDLAWRADTCALVTCTVAVEAVNRFVYDKEHGEGTFPYRAAPPSNLLEACLTDGIWKPVVGADVGQVLAKIQDMGGVPAAATTSAPTPVPRTLPLGAWQGHRWDDDGSATGGFSPERVAALLSYYGPCIGLLWTSPSYHLLDADRDGRKVYTSGYAGAASANRRKLEERYPGKVGSHAVVCFGFRRGGKHVLVLDNQKPTGPRRWVNVKEFRTLYTLSVPAPVPGRPDLLGTCIG